MIPAAGAIGSFCWLSVAGAAFRARRAFRQCFAPAAGVGFGNSSKRWESEWRYQRMDEVDCLKCPMCEGRAFEVLGDVVKCVVCGELVELRGSRLSVSELQRHVTEHAFQYERRGMVSAARKRELARGG